MSAMPTYRSTLLDRKDVALRTMAFYFEKPAGFTFKAGQYIDLILSNPRAAGGENMLKHDFTIASAPFEPRLMIATRIRKSAFKETLEHMTLGTEVGIKGPSGSFFLHNDSARPAVFIAGGIGITPFLSIVRDAMHRKLPHKMFLFYSNPTPEKIAFFSEFQKYKAQNPNFSFVATVTAEEPSPSWKGERNRVSGEMLKKYLPDLGSCTFYIAGPPGFSLAMRETLNTAGVDDDDIRSEEFAGY
ncbi:MAG: FAD-dependent oxidoreductase [Candidatus Liptonbacteria bacterium]|nr:FAD-dependent oxidoreductase [Candidatus Liptonbacteria bacterium]